MTSRSAALKVEREAIVHRLAEVHKIQDEGEPLTYYVGKLAIPGEYSMLSLGACVVGRRDEGFYAELKPISDKSVPDALKVTRFDLAELGRSGEPPEAAMAKFCDWLANACGGRKPVFVGFNAGFDWSFVNWYFHRFLGKNSFGFAPLDIKSYYMGFTGCSWEDTKSSRLRPEFQPTQPGNHNALADARAQAETFEKMLSAR